MSAPALRLLTAAACSVCHQDRPLVAGRCDHCQAQPVVSPRWLIQYEAMGTEMAHYVVSPTSRDIILRLHPTAKVTDLLSLACPVCQGACTDACDAGAGAAWEIAEADRRNVTVSELREEGR